VCCSVLHCVWGGVSLMICVEFGALLCVTFFDATCHST